MALRMQPALVFPLVVALALNGCAAQPVAEEHTPQAVTATDCGIPLRNYGCTNTAADGPPIEARPAPLAPVPERESWLDRHAGWVILGVVVTFFAVALRGKRGNGNCHTETGTDIVTGKPFTNSVCN
jgi:hypothetical protein